MIIKEIKLELDRVEGITEEKLNKAVKDFIADNYYQLITQRRADKKNKHINIVMENKSAEAEK